MMFAQKMCALGERNSRRGRVGRETHRLQSRYPFTNRVRQSFKRHNRRRLAKRNAMPDHQPRERLPATLLATDPGHPISFFAFLFLLAGLRLATSRLRLGATARLYHLLLATRLRHNLLWQRIFVGNFFFRQLKHKFRRSHTVVLRPGDFLCVGIATAIAPASVRVRTSARSVLAGKWPRSVLRWRLVYRDTRDADREGA